MKSNAGKAAGKSTFGLSRCDQTTIGAVFALLLSASAPAEAYLTSTRVPLPAPRPVEAPALGPPAKTDTPADPTGEAKKPVTADKPVAEQPPPLSPCRLALTDEIAIAPSVPDIKGPGACGGSDLVHLEAVVLADKTKVPLKPGGTMRCSMASAVVDWVRTDMTQLAGSLGTKLLELDNFDSFDCRGRNRVVGAKLSEHGRANALDLRGVKLANGQSIALTERATPRELRDQVLLSLCKRFSTVLGPGSDGYHEDHIHIDLAERRNNYRICQWEVWDQWPKIAPLMPKLRPDEAPPREVADAKEAPTEASKDVAPPVDARPADKPVVAQPTVSKPEAQAPKPAEADPVPAALPTSKPKLDARAKRPRRKPAQAPFPFGLIR